MKTKIPRNRFSKQKNTIKELSAHNSRFKRIFDEYESISDQISHTPPDIPDDFFDAMNIQKLFLEEEINEWLKEASNLNKRQDD